MLPYDDTAVKTRYSLPLGLGVIVDGECYIADTTRQTFEGMLKTSEEARGALPEVSIQDADIAMTAEAQQILP